MLGAGLKLLLKNWKTVRKASIMKSKNFFKENSRSAAVDFSENEIF